MRSFGRGALCAVVSFALLVGPVSAATNTGRLVAQATATTGTIAGSVVDTRGQGQGDTLVTLTGNNVTQTTKTAPDGSFSFTAPPGVYKITAAKGGYQGDEQDDVALIAGTSTTVRLSLAVATTDTLKVIGNTGSSTARDPRNTGITSTAQLAPTAIDDRDNANITAIAQELPGVTLERGNRSTVSNLVIRGGDTETRVEIDGHAVTAGSGGTFLASYLPADLFNTFELEKGFGVDNSNNGESAFGTINLRTPDFTDQTHAYVKQGFDNFNGSFSKFLFTGSLLKNNRLSYIAELVDTGFNGPSASETNIPLISANNFGPEISPASGLPVAGNPGTSLIGYIGDFTSGQTSRGEVFKLRYRLSDATSVWVGFLGSHFTARPQGSAYGSYEGQYTIPACELTSGKNPQASLATCTATSLYNNPAAFGYIGSTIDLYSEYPNGQQIDNEPLFEGEFRTAIGNDTLLVRPYAGTITRINDGTNEPQQPGNESYFNLVTNPTTCSPALPCYNSTNVSTVSQGFTNGAASGCPAITVGAANSLPNGIPANACFTSGTSQGVPAGTQFYQFEHDILHGVDVDYVKPFDKGVLRLGYSNRSDNTYTYTRSNGPNDNIPFTAFPNQPTGFAGFVPAFNVAYPAGTATTASATLVIPPTTERNNDLNASVLYNATDKLLLGGGVYYLNNTANYAQIDPNLTNYLVSYNNAVTAYNATGPATKATYLTISNLPYSLVTSNTEHSHIDPHAGLAYAVTPTLTLRLNGGSSETVPYAGLISGKPSFTLPGNSNNNLGLFSFKNPNLAPETTVGYDVGLDFRNGDGGVLGGDVYDYVIHNKFISLEAQNGPNVTGNGASFTTQTLNASVDRQYGLELFARRNPREGIVYNMAATLQRDYLDQLPLSYFQNLLIGGGTGLTQTYNGRQPNNTPYFQFHAEAGYNLQNFHGVIGADYFGENNSSNGPAYDTFYLSGRYSPIRHTFIQLEIDNLFNYTTLAGIAGAGPSNSGYYFITSNPITGAFGQSGDQIQQIVGRTTRISFGVNF